MHEQNYHNPYLNLNSILVHYPKLSEKELFETSFNNQEYVLKQDLNQGATFKVGDFKNVVKVSQTSIVSRNLLNSLCCAPEVARGDPCDIKADIWSLGCILYKLLVGFLPFPANSPSQ